MQARRQLALDGVRVPPMVAAALSEELALLSPAARPCSRPRRWPASRSIPSSRRWPRYAEPAAIDALDELLRLDLVRETDVPRRFRFRHPLVRRTVYEATPGGWRLGAHERTAQALAARGAPAAARAHHSSAPRARRRRRGRGLREAGEAAAQRAPASAARWFGAALRLLPARPAQERVALLLAAAEALAAAGHFADSA